MQRIYDNYSFLKNTLLKGNTAEEHLQAVQDLPPLLSSQLISRVCFPEGQESSVEFHESRFQSLRSLGNYVLGWNLSLQDKDRLFRHLPPSFIENIRVNVCPAINWAYASLLGLAFALPLIFPFLQSFAGRITRSSFWRNLDIQRIYVQSRSTAFIVYQGVLSTAAFVRTYLSGKLKRHAQDEPDSDPNLHGEAVPTSSSSQLVQKHDIISPAWSWVRFASIYYGRPPPMMDFLPSHLGIAITAMRDWYTPLLRAEDCLSASDPQTFPSDRLATLPGIGCVGVVTRRAEWDMDRPATLETRAEETVDESRDGEDAIEEHSIFEEPVPSDIGLVATPETPSPVFSASPPLHDDASFKELDATMEEADALANTGIEQSQTAEELVQSSTSVTNSVDALQELPPASIVDHTSSLEQSPEEKEYLRPFSPTPDSLPQPPMLMPAVEVEEVLPEVQVNHTVPLDSLDISQERPAEPRTSNEAVLPAPESSSIHSSSSSSHHNQSSIEDTSVDSSEPVAEVQRPVPLFNDDNEEHPHWSTYATESEGRSAGEFSREDVAAGGYLPFPSTTGVDRPKSLRSEHAHFSDSDGPRSDSDASTSDYGTPLIKKQRRRPKLSTRLSKPFHWLAEKRAAKRSLSSGSSKGGKVVAP